LWSVVAVFYPPLYWWKARLDLLSREEVRELLSEEAKRLGVKDVSNILCPLCGRELERALTVDEGGHLAPARQEIICVCGFRLDCCRHCYHFIPAEEGSAQVMPVYSIRLGEDFSRGKCSIYKEWRAIEEAVSPEMARQLTKLGISMVRMPKTVLDSYYPLPECSAFVLDEKRLGKTGVKGLGKKRRLLLALAARI